jgi:hypothetical protein
VEKEKAFEETIPDELARYKKLYNAGALSADKFLKIISALTAKNK